MKTTILILLGTVLSLTSLETVYADKPEDQVDRGETELHIKYKYLQKESERMFGQGLLMEWENNELTKTLKEIESMLPLLLVSIGPEYSKEVISKLNKVEKYLKYVKINRKRV